MQNLKLVLENIGYSLPSYLSRKVRDLNENKETNQIYWMTKPFNTW